MTPARTAPPTNPSMFDFHAGMYNVDFENLKHRLSSALEASFRNLAKEHGEASRLVYFLEHGISWYIGGHNLHVLHRRLAKLLEEVSTPGWAESLRNQDARRIALYRTGEVAPPTDEEVKTFLAAAVALAESWTPTATAMKDAKAHVIKGRKPSNDPTKTPPRTLENTGTCGVCDRNVKRESDGTLCHHGFRIRYGSRDGRCFGCGHQPHEVSSEAAKAFLTDVLLRQLKNEEAALADLKTRKPDEMIMCHGMKMTAHNAIWYQESEVRHVTHLVKDFTGRVKNWKAAPLPSDRLVGATRK